MVNSRLTAIALKWSMYRHPNLVDNCVNTYTRPGAEHPLLHRRGACFEYASSESVSYYLPKSIEIIPDGPRSDLQPTRTPRWNGDQSAYTPAR